MKITVALLLFLSSSFCSGLIGGDYANDHQFPHHLAIICHSLTREGNDVPDKVFGGGNLITPIWVLTTACTIVVCNDQDGWIIVGASPKKGIHTMKRFPERTFFYESWTVSKNNIALLMLQKPFLISKRVHPIQLMTEEVPNGADVIIAGNGHKFCFLGHWFKGDLKYNWLKFHDQKKCAEVSQLYDFNGTFCLAPTKYNEGPWKKDQGAGAVYKNKLIGIFTFTPFRCASKYASGFAKVSYYVDWIVRTIDIEEPKMSRTNYTLSKSFHKS